MSDIRCVCGCKVFDTLRVKRLRKRSELRKKHVDAGHCV